MPPRPPQPLVWSALKLLQEGTRCFLGGQKRGPVACSISSCTYLLSVSCSVMCPFKSSFCTVKKGEFCFSTLEFGAFSPDTRPCM